MDRSGNNKPSRVIKQATYVPMPVQLKVKKLYEDAVLPKYSTPGSACFDFHSYYRYDIFPGETKVVGTALAVEVPNGFFLELRPRSGLASEGIGLANSPGTIDCFSKNMKIKTVDGDKLIGGLSIDDVIFSVNENMEIEEDTIDAIVNKGEQEVYVIETDKGVVEITGNTPVYTDNGMKYPKDLTNDDKIAIFEE